MNYQQALERAKSTPVMRPHWRHYWLIWENGQYLELNYLGIVKRWFVLTWEKEATDWIEAPKPVDEF